ncbi:restriction endonuclease [Anaerolineales bacterium HSG6]|nr:restriction endonuclease [Anaerolineales bacterium HSG6]
MKKRQLDVAVCRPEETTPFLVADAKRHARPIDVKHVEAFLGMMDDVNAEVGILVAPMGFSKAAERRAKAAHLELKIMSLDEALQYRWIPFAREIYPTDPIFHLELSKAKEYLHSGAGAEIIISALEDVFFEEWEAFFLACLNNRNEDIIRILKIIAINHSDDGWRFNAIRLLCESDTLDKQTAQTIVSKEYDPDILEFIYEMIRGSDANDGNYGVLFGEAQPTQKEME